MGKGFDEFENLFMEYLNKKYSDYELLKSTLGGDLPVSLVIRASHKEYPELAFVLTLYISPANIYLNFSGTAAKPIMFPDTLIDEDSEADVFWDTESALPKVKEALSDLLDEKISKHKLLNTKDVEWCVKTMS